MKHNRFASIGLILAILCTCLMGAVAEEEREIFTDGEYQYALLDDGTAEITKYSGKEKKLFIPVELGGKKVTSIGDRAFLSCDTLTFVSIPDSILYIGANPFCACSGLKTIFVSPENSYLAVIDGVLFNKANKTLIAYPAAKSDTSYAIPVGIRSIGSYAFCVCNNLTFISIPDSITQIGDNAFRGCSSLISISIPDSVTRIDHETFFYCSSLVSVSIPSSITQIGDGAFDMCSILNSITIPEAVTEIGSKVFYTAYNPNLILTVPRNSYAAEYAKVNNIPYTYPDANDWLNN